MVSREDCSLAYYRIYELQQISAWVTYFKNKELINIKDKWNSRVFVPIPTNILSALKIRAFSITTNTEVQEQKS